MTENRIVQHPNFFSNVCPCALLIVILQAKRIGNCFLLNLNGILLSEEMRGIRGIKCVSPFSEPMRFVSTMLRCNLVTIKQVPLHKPFVGTKFRNNIIMHPGFKFNLYGGIPIGVKELRKPT
ncbi:hypothetical protein AVEN_99513-1 [Araneus ventricosus]|uniref:Uncharacterized protein n=1 Tax=Araneus ventricosus TaxID=182803 RepID=A0A4Y2V5J5_ARAVE|nr:hypothetical protein AVEN_99513-1 [Araneus ventricosus]